MSTAKCKGPTPEQKLLMQGLPVDRERAEGAPVAQRSSRGTASTMTDGDAMIQRARERLSQEGESLPSSKRRLDTSSAGRIVVYGLASGVLGGGMAVTGLYRTGFFGTTRRAADRTFIVTLACCIPTMLAALYAKLQLKPPASDLRLPR